MDETMNLLDEAREWRRLASDSWVRSVAAACSDLHLGTMKRLLAARLAHHLEVLGGDPPGEPS